MKHGEMKEYGELKNFEHFVAIKTTRERYETD